MYRAVCMYLCKASERLKVLKLKFTLMPSPFVVVVRITIGNFIRIGKWVSPTLRSLSLFGAMASVAAFILFPFEIIFDENPSIAQNTLSRIYTKRADCTWTHKQMFATELNCWAIQWGIRILLYTYSFNVDSLAAARGVGKWYAEKWNLIKISENDTRSPHNHILFALKRATNRIIVRLDSRN